MDYNHIKDKIIALLVWNTEKENDAHVYIGEIINNGADLYFVNKSNDWKVFLDEEKLETLKEVTEDTKEIFLNADLFLSLTIAGLPDDTDQNLIFTGMIWH